jgi:N-sulfoglucosamine sulfohydrolase
MNILLLTADDMNGDTPGCCGGPAEVTPTLDRLAAEGVLFRRAHVPVAICQPSRSALLTGLWPHRNGAEGFEPIRTDVTVLTDVLRAAGYRLGILGKVDHLAPVEKFGWDFVRAQVELGAGRDPRLYADAMQRFVADAQRDGQPWFLMLNAHDPHRPFSGSPAELAQFGEERLESIPAPSHVFKPGDWDVPGFLPDLPEARTEVAHYLSSSRRCDDVVAAALDVLARAGDADNTVVVFLSDNGMAFPFAKANCYLHGTRTPLIVRWPGVTPAGVVDRTHFVSTLDLFPTLCEAAGVAPPDGLDGRSLTSLLHGGTDASRDHVMTVFHENWGKQRFEMRCVQDGEHGYIWNSWSDGTTAYQAEHMATPTWQAMAAAAERDPAVRARHDFYLHRRREELYAVGDEDSLDDLSGRSGLQPVLAGYRQRLADWMDAVGDPLRDRFRDQVGV